MTAPATRPRRWFRLSLGGFLLVVLALAVWLAALAAESRRTRAALDALQAADALIVYGYQAPDGQYRPEATESSWVLWLRGIGIDLPPTAIGVQIHEPLLDDELLGKFAELRELESLEIATSFSQISDAGLASLASLPRLKEFSLSPAHEITDAGFLALGRSRSLESVSFHGSRITGRGASDPAVFPALERLRLDDSRLDDAGLGEIVSGRSIQFLGCCRTQVTDAGLAALAGQSRLESLELAGLPITAFGLRSLRDLEELHDLDLAGVPLDDAAIQACSELARLESLSIDLAGPVGERLAPLKSTRLVWLTLGVESPDHQPSTDVFERSLPVGCTASFRHFSGRVYIVGQGPQD